MVKRGSAWSDVGSLPTLDTSPKTSHGEAGMATSVGAALHLDEVARTRVFLRVVFSLVAVTLAVVPFLGGDPFAGRLLMGGCAAAAVACALFHRVIGKPGGYTSGRLFAFVLTALSAVMCGVYYFGILSAAPIGFVLGISVFGMANRTRVTLALYLFTAVGYALLAALVVGGVIADRGLLPVTPLGTSGALVIVAVVEAFMCFSYVQARLTRRTTIDAVTRLERAVRAVAQREAVLQEARQELDRAAWIGGPGRFTEQTLGSWRLGVVIGRGAMGEVYEAEHVGKGAPAAVKLLHRNVLAEPHLLERFVREASAAARLTSRHVVRVLEVSPESAAIPYLVMERLRGHDLAHHLRSERRFRPERVAELVREVAEGLEHARAAGIVHRDLKPHNIFLDESGPVAWKILDFGMSKLVDQGGTLTRGQIVGTPAFMSPEQAQGLEVDHRTDVYALAAVAYRALTGTMAFTGDDPILVLRDVMEKMPPRPGQLTPLSPQLDAVLAIGLTKRPEDRFDTAAELATQLALAVKGELGPATVERAHALLGKLAWGGVSRSHAAGV